MSNSIDISIVYGFIMPEDDNFEVTPQIQSVLNSFGLKIFYFGDGYGRVNLFIAVKDSEKTSICEPIFELNLSEFKTYPIWDLNLKNAADYLKIKNYKIGHYALGYYG